VSFEWPLALLALALVPVTLAAYLLYERRRPAHVSQFASPALFPNLVPRAPGRRRHVPVAVLLVALAVLLIGLGRPHAALSFPRKEATIVLTLDVSRSMAAADVEPTRLGAAQAAARRFLERVPDSFQIGVVTFATRAQVVSPATDDRGVTEAALNSIRVGEGTALGEAIELSLRVARSVPGEEGNRAPPAAMLLLSDGAQTQGERTPAQAARLARRARIPIYTVAVGTPGGVVERPIPGGYRERIRVPPDPATLQRVAAATGGEFFSAGDDERLRRVYEELGTRLGRKKERTEVTTAFAGAGIVLLLAAGALSAVWFRRLP
jgi:Ca-activated chloride channel family protein